ncbi:MAG: hypothetical protein CR977_00795 [Gammaproteobacteria bacterium]|nr:MAG: hypothetical protein CR977_00795 [Gammaproteobacteria bacterium]
MPNNTLFRADINETIELPEDMQWTDEFEWSDLAQATPQYTRGGALVIQQSTKLAGRPVTLGGEWVWVNRGDYKKLQEWTAIPQLQMTLTLHNANPARTFTVTFRTHEGAIDCRPVVFTAPELDDAPYTGEIRLIII